MDRRKFFKGVGIGGGVVAGGIILPALAADKWGPGSPEIADPRPPSLWEEDADPFPQTPSIKSDLQADVAVIGSGITGLSAAWTLKEMQPELKVFVLDSHRPCSGASSRNSAHLFPSYNGWQKILASQGPEAAKTMNRFSRRAVESVIDFVTRHDIDCGLHREPLVWLSEQDDARASNDLVRRMKQAGLEGNLYTGNAFREKSGGMTFYKSCVEVEENYIMHPGKLMKGILEKAMEHGIEVYSRSPVLEVRDTDSRTETNILKTPKGSVAAKKVLFATNAYTPRINRRLSSNMVPIVLATVATEPMSRAQRDAAALAWNHFTELKLISRTIGLTPDLRTYLRGILGYSSFNSCFWRDLDGAYKRLEKELRERAPWVEGLKIDRKWPGAVAMTMTSSPIAGPLPQNGQYVCAGYNGHGMAEGFYHSRLVAHQMIGARHPDCKFLKGPSGWIPPEPHRSIGAKTFFFFAL